MFERNRIDNRPEAAPVPVEIELHDGGQTRGKLKVPPGLSPLDVLNGQGGFVEFEPYGGEVRFIDKSTIAALWLVGIPRAPRLGTSSDDFDPHAVLGLTADSTFDEVRQAYVQLTKVYHPDRFASVALPKEVSAYLDAMTRRINAAFAALDAAHRTTRTVRAAQTQPIYTSQPR
jgi:hypothetical protein